MTNGWLEVMREALKVPGLLVEIYGDLAKPGVRQVGKALDSIIGLGNTILWPITWANERSRVCLERNLEMYRQRLAETPEEKIISVAPEIGVPISEKLSYVSDHRLSELYVNLLAKASSAETVSQAHPSFANIIDNLSPDEAQLLEFFATKKDLMFVMAKRVEKKTGEFNVVADLLISQALADNLHFGENVPAYISNLEGLGLVRVHQDRLITDIPAYEKLEAYWLARLSPEEEAADDTTKLEFLRGTISISLFGRLFISACRNDHQS